MNYQVILGLALRGEGPDESVTDFVEQKTYLLDCIFGFYPEGISSVRLCYNLAISAFDTWYKILLQLPEFRSYYTR